MADVISIDKSGRLVIPAAIRRELALSDGAELRCTIEDGSIRLEPLGGATLARRSGRLVVTSALVGPVPDHRDIREERIQAETKS